MTLPIQIKMTITKTDPLYFIAIVPPKEIADIILPFKQDMAARFASKAALKSPPHITLHMPFRLKDKKLDLLEEVLAKVAVGSENFRIQLANFDCFAPRVIFVALPENSALAALQDKVLKNMKQLNLFNGNYKDRPFHPHVTIGFRDLKPAFFKLAWEEYKERQLNLDFMASHLSLLKHNGKQWEVYKEFALASS